MTRYRGQAVSEGTAAGVVWAAQAVELTAAPTAERVREAFAAVAGERLDLAAALRARGDVEAAGILEVGALIASDPALVEPVLAAMRDGVPAATAVAEAAEAQAAVLAALPDPDLAQRAGDVRQVAIAVLGELADAAAPPPPEGPFILVRRDVDPADLIRLTDPGPARGYGPGAGSGACSGAGSGSGPGRLAGAVSVGGGASSHAAIVARGLGLPMLAGADAGVLDVPAGTPAVLDGAAGELVTEPEGWEPPRAATATAATTTTGGRQPAVAAAGGLASTRDGARVTVLCNVASAAETRLGLSAGAAGVGLLRTEMPFTGATDWPTESEHLARLVPVLAGLEGKTAVVRLLDFSGDKVPPFLAGRPAGLTALLDAPHALGAQLRAILRAGRHTRLSVLVPMVTSPAQVRVVRERLAEAAGQVGTEPPGLGIMVEVAATARQAEAFAAQARFFSVGTNDLTSDVLGLDRARTTPSRAADPRVLALIEHVVRVGVRTGVEVSVCGDAAADPDVLPLLLKLGVRTLSVGAARVPQVAAWIAATDLGREAADPAREGQS